MQALFAFLTLGSLAALVIGLWKPSAVLPKRIPQNRVVVLLLYFGLIFVRFTFLPTPPKAATASPTKAASVPPPKAAESAATTAKTEKVTGVSLPPPAESKTPESRWRSQHDQDGMGRERWFTWVKSTNTVDFHFPYGGDQRAQLAVRATATEIKDVRVSIERGQFACSISDCSVRVRFDNGAIRRYGVSDSNDHSTTVKFIDDYRGFLTALRKAKTVRIEATFYQEGDRAFEFNTAGFDW